MPPTRCTCGHLAADHEPDVGCLACDCLAWQGMTGPALPYAGTSGHAPAPSSRDAVVAQDRDGRTASRQAEAREYLRVAGIAGMTWRELDGWSHWGHGTCSRVLSVLHKRGKAERLTERRRNCAVYVLPSLVNGRPTEPQGRAKRDLLTPEERKLVEGMRAVDRLGPPHDLTIEGKGVLAIIDRIAPDPMDYH